MKTLILCAGYATRLYPLTLNQPKHLLPIAGKPMLQYITDELEKIKEIDEIYLVTNRKFFHVFEDWVKKLKTRKKLLVFNDGTLSDETKLGAVGDMDFVIKKAKIDDDLLVIAGDNLFRLKLKNFINFFKNKGTAIALYDVGSKELMKKYSEVRLDASKRLVYFQEKPQQPETTLAAICMYLFHKNQLGLIQQYLVEKNSPDQPGRYIQWLYQRQPVYGFVFTETWYDIGDIDQYHQADKEFMS
ncbi:MAG: nucleotidyltransferase family protein [Elusimicrobiota bacterium]